MKSSGNPHTLPLYFYTVKDHSIQSDPYMHIASSSIRSLRLLHLKASRDLAKSSLERHLKTEKC
jgi:hypothetical protein